MGKKRSTSVVRWVTLYYAEGLPFSLVRQVSVVFFKDQGVSLGSLGLVAFYGIPWTFKFLWGPLVDRYFTKRSWILVMELLLGAAFGFVGLSVLHGGGVKFIAVLFLLIAFLAATHDIAVDGFYLEAIPDKNEQAKYSGLLQMGYRLAMITGAGFLVGISGKIPWWGIFTSICFFFLLLRSWHGFALPEPEPFLRKGRDANIIPIVQGFQTFLLQPGIGLAIIFFVLFKVGDALLFAMSTPFLLDLGIHKGELGFISGVLGTTSAIMATIFGGWFISKYSLRKGLYIFGIIQNLAIPAYAFVAWAKPNIYWVAAVAMIEQIAAGLGAAAYTNFAMRQTNPKYRATHYAIVTGLASLTVMLSGAISGFGAQKYGYFLYFLLAFAASLPGLFLIPFVARRPECQ